MRRGGVALAARKPALARGAGRRGAVLAHEHADAGVGHGPGLSPRSPARLFPLAPAPRAKAAEGGPCPGPGRDDVAGARTAALRAHARARQGEPPAAPTLAAADAPAAVTPLTFAARLVAAVPAVAGGVGVAAAIAARTWLP